MKIRRETKVSRKCGHNSGCESICLDGSRDPDRLVSGVLSWMCGTLGKLQQCAVTMLCFLCFL